MVNNKIINELKADKALEQKHGSLKDEHYLTSEQLKYFRERLLALREEHQKKIAVHTQRLQMVSLHEPDVIDRASRETDRSLEIQARDREQKIIFRINEALSRIDNGTYGYCEEMGMPIGLSRLNVYPMATLSLEAQTNFERLEKVRLQHKKS